MKDASHALEDAPCRSCLQRGHLDGRLIQNLHVFRDPEDQAYLAKLVDELPENSNLGIRITVPADSESRRRLVRKFIRENQKRASLGLALAVLFLPEGTLAQEKSSFVPIGGVEGVRSAVALADGTVQVTLDSGRTVIISAQNVQILQSGEIIVSQAAVSAIGEAIVVGVGGGLGWGGLAAGLGGAVAAGAGADALPTPAAAASSGFVVDGYVAGATVFRDLNANGVLDPGEPNVLTDDRGEFIGLVVDASNPGAKIISTGGVDIASGKPFGGTLTAPADSTVITPITTMVQALIESSGTPLTSEEAATQVKAALGLPANSDILNEDPVQAAEEGDLTALKASTQIANIINLAAAAGGEDSQASSASASASLAQALVSAQAGDPDPLNDAGVITSVLTEAVGAARASDVAQAASSANTIIENTSNDELGLAEIEQILTVVQGDLVDRAQGGDTIGETDVQAAAAAIVPLRPTLDRGVTEINAAAKADGITFVGTGRPASEVTLDFGGQVKAATVGEDGAWSVSFAPNEFPADPVGGTVIVRATAQQSADAPASPASTRTIALDSTAPEGAVITAVAADGTVNAAEAEAGFAVTGTAEANTLITVSIAGLDAKTATVGQDGTWSVAFAAWPGEDGTFDIATAIVDGLGNAGPATTGSFVVDTEATAQPTLSTVAGDDTIDAAEAAAGVAISGSAEANASVTVTLGSVAKTVTATAAGTYSAAFSSAEIPTDGSALVSVVAIDAVGNTSSLESRLVEVNTAPPGAPVIERITADNVLNQTESAADVVISGTIVDGSNVAVTLGANTVAATVTGTTWTASFSAQQLGADRAATVTAIATDGDGNTASSSRDFVIDRASTTPTINQIGGNGVVNASEAANGVVFGGTAEAGSSVTVVLGELSKTVIAGPDGLYAALFSAADLLLTPNGEVNATVTALDRAGNTSPQASRSFTLDTSAPDAPRIDAISGDGGVNKVEAAAGIAITGTAEAGANISVSIGGASQTTTADQNGAWSVPFASRALPGDGTNAVSVTATDANGNTSAVAQSSLVLDTSAPGKPTINVVSWDGIVNDSEKTDGVVVTGTAEANVSVAVRVGTTEKTVTAGQDGQWSAHYSDGELPSDGARVVTAATIDAAGNASTATNRTFVVDTSIAAPVINDVGRVTPNQINAGEHAAGITVEGTAEPGATVSVRLGNVTHTDVADDSSSFWSVSFAAGEMPENGTDTLVAFMTRPGGQASVSTIKVLEFDSIVPVQPTINPVGTNGMLNAADKAAGVQFEGFAEPDTTVSVVVAFSEGPSPAQTVKIGSDGRWSIFQPPEQVGGDGAGSVTVTSTDDAGNVSVPATQAFTLDAFLPIASLRQLPTGSDIDPFERIEPLKVTGFTEPGLSVTVYMTPDNGDAVQSLTATAGSNRVFTAQFGAGSLPASGNVAFTAIVTDLAGNVGPVSAPVSASIDSTPIWVALTQLSSGAEINLADRAHGVFVHGTGTPGAHVTVTMGLPYGVTRELDAITAADGTFSVAFSKESFPIASGDATFTAALKNGDGTVVRTSETINAAVDFIAPPEPSISLNNHTFFNASDVSSGVDITGRGERGGTVTLLVTFADGALAPKTAIVGVDGHWSISIAPGEFGADGAASLTASITDVLGNGSASTTKAATVDTVGPSATINPLYFGSVIDAPGWTTSLRVEGTTEPDARVEVTMTSEFGPAQTVDRVTVSSNGEYWAVFDTSYDPTWGDVSFVAVATDEAGNIGASSTPAVASRPALPTINQIGDANGFVTAADTNQGLQIDGTAERLSSVVVTITFADGTTVQKTDTDYHESWSVTVAPEEFGADGPIAVSVVATDYAGNERTLVTANAVVDTLGPAVTLTSLSSGPVISTAERDSGVDVTGTTEASSPVTVSLRRTNEGKIEKTVTAGSDGSFTAQFAAADIPADGAMSFDAFALDTLGNRGVTSDPIAATRPERPGVFGLSKDSPFNAKSFDARDASNGFDVTGTGEPGSTITVYLTFADGAIAPKTGTVDSSGKWTVTIAPGDFGTDGAGTIAVTATDGTGEESDPVTGAVVLDTVAPPVDLRLADSDGVINAYDLSGDVVLLGTTDPFAQAFVRMTPNGDITSAVTKSDTADAGGRFIVRFGTADIPSSGSVAFTASAVDSVGNGSADTAPVTATLDLVAPNVALNALSIGSGLSAAERGAGVDVTGTTESGASVVVTLYTSGSVLAVTKTAMAGAGGSFSARFETADLPSSGIASFSAVATDVSGNASIVSNSVSTIIDLQAPTVTLDDLSAGGLIGEIARNNGVDVTGTAEASATVVVKLTPDAGATVEKTVNTNSDGTFTAQFVTADIPTSGGISFTAVATDRAGNVGPASSAVTASVDTSSFIVALDPLPTGTVVSGAERLAGFDLTGTTEANAAVTVTLSVHGTATVVSKMATASADGTFTIRFEPGHLPVDGGFSIIADATNGVGDPSTYSPLSALDGSVDSTGPVPSIYAVGINGNDIINSDHVAEGLQLSGAVQLNGQPEEGGTYEVTLSFSDGSSLGPIATTNQFDWGVSIAAEDLGADGPVSITVVGTDVHGNVGEPVTRQVVLDTQAPVVTLTSLSSGEIITEAERSDGISVAGTTEAGLEVFVSLTSDGGSQVRKSVTTDDAGGFTLHFDSSDIPNSGDLSFTAFTYDLGWNRSEDSVALTASIEDAQPQDPDGPADPDGPGGPSETVLPALVRIGTAADETLEGGLGNDLLISGGGTDTLRGGEGRDYFVYSGGTVVFADFADGDNMDLTASGLTHDEIRAAILAAPDGDDTVIQFGQGASLTLQGFSASVAKEFMNSDPKQPEGILSVLVTPGAQASSLPNLENLLGDTIYNSNLTPTSDASSITFTNPAAANFGGAVVTAVVTGNGFAFDVDDNPTGGEVTDVSFSVAGAEVLNAELPGIGLLDLLAALGQPDAAAREALFANFRETVTGTSGADIITQDIGGRGLIAYGLGGNDRLIGSEDRQDILNGGADDDTLYGGGDDDYLIGGVGSDLLLGGRGNDVFYGDSSDMVSFAEDDTTRAFSNWEQSTQGVTANLATGVAIDQYNNVDTLIGIGELRGTEFADRLTGDANSNRLEGLGGADLLVSGAGGGTIVGGTGTDTIVLGHYISGSSENDDLVVDATVDDGSNVIEVSLLPADGTFDIIAGFDTGATENGGDILVLTSATTPGSVGFTEITLENGVLLSSFETSPQAVTAEAIRLLEGTDILDVIDDVELVLVKDADGSETAVVRIDLGPGGGLEGLTAVPVAVMLGVTVPLEDNILVSNPAV